MTWFLTITFKEPPSMTMLFLDQSEFSVLLLGSKSTMLVSTIWFTKLLWLNTHLFFSPLGTIYLFGFLSIVINKSSFFSVYYFHWPLKLSVDLLLTTEVWILGLLIYSRDFCLSILLFSLNLFYSSCISKAAFAVSFLPT